MKLLWMPLALDRVDEIVDYISRDRPQAAENWAVGLFDFVEKLQQSPKRGRTVPEFGRDEIRELHYKNYRVIYRLDEDRISILTVRHGRRLLDPEEIRA